MKFVRVFSEIVKKNFKLLYRARASALVIFLGPLLLITLLGLAFSSSQQFSIAIGVYSEKYSDLTNSLIKKLSESNFKVVKYQTETKCISSVKRGINNVCVVFPPDLDVSTNASNEISFHVDYSRMNLVWMVLDVITKKVSEESEEISTWLTSILLEKLNKTSIFVESSSLTVDELIKTNDELNTKMKTFYAQLGDLKLDIDPKEFKMEQLATMRDLIFEATNASILTAQTMITQLYDSIGEANCTDAGDAYDLLGDAEETFNELQENLSSLYNGTGDSFLPLMENLQNKIGEVESKFESASELRNEIIENPEIRKKISDTAKKLSKLKDAVSELKEELSAITIKEAGRIVNPITTKINPVTVQTTYFNYLFPTLVVLVIMITAILLSSTIVLTEKKSIAYFRNVIAPVKDIVFNLATYATSFVIIVLQLIIFLIIGGIFFKANLLPALLVTLANLFFIATMFIFIGMIVGYAFKSQETATLGALTLSFIMLFFSSTVLPIETMPSYVQAIAYVNPFVVSEAALRQSIVFSYGFGSVAKYIYLMFAYSVILFGAAYVLQKITKRQYIFSKNKMRIK